MFLKVWFRSQLLYFISFCSELEKFLVGHRFLGQITNFNSSTRSGFIKSAQVFKRSLTRDFPGSPEYPVRTALIFFGDKHSFANTLQIFQKNRGGPKRILSGLGDTDS
jgi:hypothetical protein